jgi:hypothetical protein
MEILAGVLIGLVIGYVIGHWRGTIHGLKQLDKLLSIPPGKGIAYEKNRSKRP